MVLWALLVKISVNLLIRLSFSCLNFLLLFLALIFRCSYKILHHECLQFVSKFGRPGRGTYWLLKVPKILNPALELENTFKPPPIWIISAGAVHELRKNLIFKLRNLCKTPNILQNFAPYFHHSRKGSMFLKRFLIKNPSEIVFFFKKRSLKMFPSQIQQNQKQIHEA